MISHGSEKSVNCTIIGDGMVGKTEICQTFSGEKNSEEYKATVTDELKNFANLFRLSPDLIV
jgi:GTPase SAR1 family protein